MRDRLSVRALYDGRHILVTGTSGFVGKVWLAMALEHLPNIGQIYVLIRKKGSDSARQRFEKIVGSSPAFKPLHERHGPNIGAFLARRVKVLDGDVSEPNFGLAEDVLARLRRDLDLIVNVAGIVNFKMDLRDGISTNVCGAVHAAELARSCDHAALLHVSTCYVVGSRSGRFPEIFHSSHSPNGKPLDAETELTDVNAAIERITSEHGTDDAEELHKRMRAEGQRRALDYGWPNIYTYTKGLAEALLVRRSAGRRFSVFRPSIVESALECPMVGWNEGFDTAAPILHLIRSWVRFLPVRKEQLLDIIPVDMVCKAMMTAGAALIGGVHSPVYQCGTSDRNPLTIGRTCDLVALAHREEFRKPGQAVVERVVLSRWDVVPVPESCLKSISPIRTIFRNVGELLQNLSERLPSDMADFVLEARKKTRLADRRLAHVEETIELVVPLLNDNRYVFECRAIAAHDVLEPEFRFEPETIDWRHYWIHVHVPGIHRWCFPHIENRPLETYTPAHPFHFPAGKDD